MLPPERPDRIQIAFDDHRLVANAGLILRGNYTRLRSNYPTTPHGATGGQWPVGA